MDPRDLIDLDQLKRIAARQVDLPPGPWRAVEVTALELEGPQPWDPDIDPDRAAHERRERLRAEHAAWRGLVDAHGTPLVGEPVKGGTPQTVVDPIWRFLAEARGDIAYLLDTLRALWRALDTAADSTPPAAPEPTPAPPDPPQAAVDDHPQLERAARAAYQAIPTAIGWDALDPDEQDRWRARALAVVGVLDTPST